MSEQPCISRWVCVHCKPKGECPSECGYYAAEKIFTSNNSGSTAITAIEGAIRIKDLWLPNKVDAEHSGKAIVLHAMYRTFLKVIQNCS